MRNPVTQDINSNTPATLIPHSQVSDILVLTTSATEKYSATCFTCNNNYYAHHPLGSLDIVHSSCASMGFHTVDGFPWEASYKR